MKYLRIGTYLPLALLIMAACILLFTSSGPILLLSAANNIDGVEIETKELRGSLFRGLEINGFYYRGKGLNLDIAELSLRVRLPDLIFGALHIPAIKTRGVRIELEDSDGGGPIAGESPLPFRFSIGRALIDELVVIQSVGAEPQAIEHMEFGLLATGNRLNLRDLSLKKERLAFNTDALLDLVSPFTFHAVSLLQYEHPERGHYSASLHTKGNSDEILATVSFPSGPAGKLHLRVKDPLADLQWQAKLYLDKLAIADFSPDLPDLSGTLELTMQGNLSRLEANGNLQEGLYRQESADKGQVTQLEATSSFTFGFEYGDGRRILDIHSLLLDLDAGRLVIKGQYDIDSHRFSASANWDELSLPSLKPEQPLQLAGLLNIAGNLDSYTLDTNLALRESGGIPATRLSGSGAGNRSGLIMDGLTIDLPAGQLSTDLKVAWGTKTRLSLNWQGKDLDPGTVWQNWPGSLNVQGALHIIEQVEGFGINLEEARLTGTLRDVPVSLAATAQSLNTGEYDIDAKAAYAGSSALVKGHWGETMDLDWRIDAPDVSRIDRKFGGHIGALGRASGTRKQPRIVAEIRAADLDSPWGKLRELVTDLDLDLSGENSIKASVRLREGTYNSLGLEYLDLSINGSNGDHLYQLDSNINGIALELIGTGGLVKTRWQGLIERLNVEHALAGKWSLVDPVQADFSNKRLSLNEACLEQEQASICGSGIYQHEPRRWTVRSRARNLALEKLPLDKNQVVALKGLLDFDLALEQESEQGLTGRAAFDIPAGTVAVSLLDNADALLILDDSAVQLTLAEDVLRLGGEIPAPGQGFAPLKARLQLHDFSAAGAALDRVSIDGGIVWAADDLAFLNAFLPRLLDTHGRASLDIQLAGSLAEPAIKGVVNLNDAGFSSPDLGIAVNAINLTGRSLSEDHYEIAGTMHSGDGHLAISARAKRLEKSGPVFDIELDGEQFELLNLPELWAKINPAINGSLSLEQQILSGTVLVPEASIDLDELSLVTATSADEVIIDGNREITAQPRASEKIQVRLELGDAVSIKGKGISGSLAGNLDVFNDEKGLLFANGRIDIVDGRFSAYGQSLQIEEGFLQYHNSALDNPVLGVTAVRKVNDISVGIKITGYAMAPSVNLFSSSGLSQEETLAYLVFGRSLNNLNVGEGEDLLGAATSMGLQNSGFITGKIASRFGLDQLTLSGSSADSTSLVIGKYLNPKLYLSYGLGVFDKISTARMRYELSRRFSLEAERGAETGVDLFYRIDR